ncbi:hypothetical protein A9Q81_20820 [Gammaproteobacteria bacterium 42_54_T18]|nr:hypothetical protein A9Q81_20820 [Gammaproteobacteria bacterium 42_54_T18]
MKILITGAFGNLGLMCVDRALALGYDVRCFDVCTKKNQKIAQQYGNRIETFFGDIRDSYRLKNVVKGVDGIIHNASILPPLTESNPKFSKDVNVEGTRCLISCAEVENPLMRFIFPSSVTVFGFPSLNEVPRTVLDSVEPTDNYTDHKLTCETMLKESQLEWCVLRVGVSVDSRTLRTDWATFKKLLQVRADNPLEYVHPKDVAFAMCQALIAEDAPKKVLLIGGGQDCQITQKHFLGVAMSACGLTLDSDAFGQDAFYTHWMNTEESQRILQYQAHDVSDYLNEMQVALRRVRILLTPVRPIVNMVFRNVMKSLARK